MAEGVCANSHTSMLVLHKIRWESSGAFHVLHKWPRNGRRPPQPLEFLDASKATGITLD